MEWIELLKFSSALLVGFTMGLLGGGGSILTIPIFVYLFAINPIAATGYSLLVVGFTASIGAFRNFQKKTIDFKVGLLFGLPTMIGTYITRRYFLPAMPNDLLTIGDFTLSKSLFIMVLFATIMLAAAFSMIRSGRKQELPLENLTKPIKKGQTILSGSVIGVVTGFIGAGGGFIMVPALALLANLPMRKAIGTSLFIITLKSFIGFLGDLQVTSVNWVFIGIFTIMSMIGILIGVKVAQYVKARNLKSIFGWFILVVGLYVIYQEFIA